MDTVKTILVFLVYLVVAFVLIVATATWTLLALVLSVGMAVHFTGDWRRKKLEGGEG